MKSHVISLDLIHQSTRTGSSIRSFGKLCYQVYSVLQCTLYRASEKVPRFSTNGSDIRYSLKHWILKYDWLASSLAFRTKPRPHTLNKVSGQWYIWDFHTKMPKPTSPDICKIVHRLRAKKINDKLRSLETIAEEIGLHVCTIRRILRRTDPSTGLPVDGKKFGNVCWLQKTAGACNPVRRCLNSRWKITKIYSQENRDFSFLTGDSSSRS